MTERSGADVQAGVGARSEHLASLPVELLEATTDCVFVLDADWRFIYLNARAVSELGGEKLLGTSVWQSFPNAGGSKFEEVYRRVVERRESETFEAFYPPPLNAWYEAHALPFRETLVVFFRNVTKRRRATDALRRRHNELDMVLSQAGVGIMQCTEDHRLIVVNDQFCSLLGRSREELDGLPMEAYTHPDDVPWNAELLRKHRQSEEPFYLQKRYVRPGGEMIWCSVAVSFVRHCETNEPTTIVVAREITDEVVAQHRAEEVQSLLEAVVDGAEDLIFVKNDSGSFVLVNEKMRAEFGIAPGQKGGDRFPDFSERFSAEDRQVMKSGHRLVIEEHVPRAGELLTYQTIKVPWKRDGVIKGVIGISRDISDRVRHEKLLRESEERFRLAALATMDAIWEWDLASDKVQWSSSAAHLTGDSPGRSLEWWSERVHPEDREPVVDSLASFVESGDQRWECEYRFRRPDGAYAHILDRGFLLRDGSGNALRIIGAMSDITERVKAQERIRGLQAELIHISRISAMETMGSTLAHEVSQPLTAAGNYLLGARRLIDAGESVSAAEIREGLSHAQAEITRAGEIIRRVRRMVEHGVVETKPVQLLEVVREALRMAIPASQVDVLTRSVDVPSGLVVLADPVQLQQVLFNLIRNSVEAVAGTELKHVGISARQQKSHVLVRVTDSGEGIPRSIVPRLFSAFASTKPGGLGVGLSVCRTIIEAHGGKIWAEDREDGAGTTIAFTVPAAEVAESSV